MDLVSTPAAPVELARLSTHIPGLDTVLGGGLFVGDAYLVTGKPGTGKTTLGNQMAFAHARAGGTVLFATLLTESHDRMLAHLRGFPFADTSLVGERIHYISLLDALRDGDVDGVMATLLTTVRGHRASLLIIDGAGAARMLAHSSFDFARFIHGIQARTAILGCTTVLFSGERESAEAETHADGVITLSNTSDHSRDVRWLRVSKLRGSRYLNGRHSFTIGDDGVVVFPRLEVAHAKIEPAWPDTQERLEFGVTGLDAMTGGGLSAGTSTLVFGTPGSGKTILGLHFLAEGARQGERGLIAGFQETRPALASTANGADIELDSAIDSGLVRVLWRSPLDLAPDEWAWQLLAAIEEHRPRRLVIDCFSDLGPFFGHPDRMSTFATALAIDLRDRGVTTLFNFEVDTLVGPELMVPVPNLSATMDNALLLRTVELRSAQHRMVTILKQRQTAHDTTIREIAIGPQGIVVGDPFDASALLSGSATPAEVRQGA